VRVVADSHVLIFYLLQPEKLTDQALAALLEAEETDGVVVSAATIGDLWYASHKSRPKSLAPGVFELLRQTVLDPSTNLEVVPIEVDTMKHFYCVPLADLADPFDRFILATAAQLELPLVTADRAIRKTNVVEVIW
jgi:PIN domain nuclease of toxin-antitoxin system